MSNRIVQDLFNGIPIDEMGPIFSLAIFAELLLFLGFCLKSKKVSY